MLAFVAKIIPSPVSSGSNAFVSESMNTTSLQKTRLMKASHAYNGFFQLPPSKSCLLRESNFFYVRNNLFPAIYKTVNHWKALTLMTDGACQGINLGFHFSLIHIPSVYWCTRVNSYPDWGCLVSILFWHTVCRPCFESPARLHTLNTQVSYCGIIRVTSWGRYHVNLKENGTKGIRITQW